jgi:hypothetical protein
MDLSLNIFLQFFQKPSRHSQSWQHSQCIGHINKIISEDANAIAVPLIIPAGVHQCSQHPQQTAARAGEGAVQAQAIAAH